MQLRCMCNIIVSFLQILHRHAGLQALPMWAKIVFPSPFWVPRHAWAPFAGPQSCISVCVCASFCRAISLSIAFCWLGPNSKTHWCLQRIFSNFCCTASTSCPSPPHPHSFSTTMQGSLGWCTGCIPSTAGSFPFHFLVSWSANPKDWCPQALLLFRTFLQGFPFCKACRFLSQSCSVLQECPLVPRHGCDHFPQQLFAFTSGFRQKLISMCLMSKNQLIILYWNALDDGLLKCTWWWVIEMKGQKLIEMNQ